VMATSLCTTQNRFAKAHYCGQGLASAVAAATAYCPLQQNC